VPFEPVQFIDNQSVLDLIELKPYGLLNLLDEEVRLPKGDDGKWLSKCLSAQAACLLFGAGSGGRSTFIVQHYAGVVAYESSGFCEKNVFHLFAFACAHIQLIDICLCLFVFMCICMCVRQRDNLFRDLHNLMNKSHHPLFRVLFPDKDKNAINKLETLSGAFRKQLVSYSLQTAATTPTIWLAD
jgi:myosin heavy subunit